MILGEDKKYLLVGFKQTMRVIEQNLAKTVYIARDCEERMFNTLESSVRDKGCGVFYVDTMKELGKLSGIDKGASCAVIKKHD